MKKGTVAKGRILMLFKGSALSKKVNSVHITFTVGTFQGKYIMGDAFFMLLSLRLGVTFKGR